MKYTVALLLLFSIPALAQDTGAQYPWSPRPPRTGHDTFHYFNISDTNIALYSLPEKFARPAKWQSGFLQYYNDAYYTQDLTLAKALRIIDKERECRRLIVAARWCFYHPGESFAPLIARLSAKKKTGLTSAGDLMVIDRIGTGEAVDYGHGCFLSEDIFTIAGRASWILNNITGEHFAVVNAHTTADECTAYKRLWVAYIRGLKSE